MRKSNVTRAAEAAEIESIRRSLVSLRRLFQRRELAQLWSEAFGRRADVDYTDLRLLDAVRVAARDDAEPGATVGEVGRLLGLDPSRASRLVASGVRRGLLVRKASQGDARKVLLEITARGRVVAEKGSALTRSRIALALELGAFGDDETKRLAVLLERFVGSLLAPEGSARGR